MLDILINPKRRKTLVSYIILGLICLVFVFMDAGSFLGGSGSVTGYAARVNDSLISHYEHRMQVDQLSRFYSQIYGPDYGTTSEQRRSLASQALQQLVSKEILSLNAEKEGLYVSDLELANTIQSIGFLQVDGVFQKDAYDMFLQQQRVGAGQFERLLRKDLLQDKVRTLFTNTILPSKVMQERMEDIKKYRRSVSYAVIDTNALVEAEKISSAEVEAALSDQAVLAEIKQYFEANKGGYSIEEQVQVSHILFAASDTASQANAREQAQQVFQELNPQNFAEKAKELSADPGSKDRGGDLGYIQRGDMVGEFEDKVFSTEVGSISQPFQSPFGYHIVYVRDKKAATVADFEINKMDAAKKYLAKQQSSDTIKNLNQALETKNSSQVETLARAANLKWQELNDISLDGSNLGNLSSVSGFLSTAYSLEQGKPFPNKLLRSGDKYYLLKFASASIVNSEATPDENQLNVPGARPDVSPLAMQVMDQWMTVASEKAKITTNASVLQ